MDGMKTIGLVGGVASGKSRVAQMLVDLGAGLVDADRAGHAVLAEDAEVQQALRERWGDAVFAADGSVDRPAVARSCFRRREGRGGASGGFSKALVHPRIGERLAAERDQFAAEGTAKSSCWTRPLLFEAGWRPMCDLVLFVDAPRDVRLAAGPQARLDRSRICPARGRPVARRREASAADVIISNAGT